MSNGDTGPSYGQLMEKIIRAKIELEKVKRREHKLWCPAADDTGYGPCTCGADAEYQPVSNALYALKL